MFKKLFGLGKAPSSDEGLYRRIQCRRCGTIVTVRIDPRNDLSLNDEGTGYLVRKVVVDDRCYSRIEVRLTFDINRHQTSADIEGGSLAQEES